VKKVLLMLAVVGALGLATAPAMADSIRHFPQQATEGFYRGQTIEYLDFGPIKLKPGNKVAPIWAVTNGVDDQYNIVDVVPGQAGYTPLWGVKLVTWKDGVTPRKLMSAAAVRAAVTAGDATVKDAGMVVNCPVI
jgi:hypothetical protein